MKLRTKVMGGFLIIAVVAMVLGVAGLMSVTMLDRLNTEYSNLQKENSSIVSVLNSHYVWRHDLTDTVLLGNAFSGSLDSSTCSLGKWYDSEQAKTMSDPESLRIIETLGTPHKAIHEEAQTVLALLDAGDREGAQLHLETAVFPAAEQVITALTRVNTRYDELVAIKDAESVRISQTAGIAIVVLIVVSAIFCVVIALFITRSINKPIARLVDVARNVAQGNLNINIDTSSKDETGVLAKDFADIVAIFKNLEEDIHRVSHNYDIGDLGKLTIDEAAYIGGFRNIAEAINNTVADLVGSVLYIADSVIAIGNGNFDIEVKQYAGQKILLTNALQTTKDNLLGFIGDIGGLTRGVSDGELSVRVKTDEYQGGWHEMVSGLNVLLDTVAAPAEEISLVMSRVAQGDFNRKMTGNYKGDFLALQNSVNTTVTNIASYIDEIARVLTQLAQNDLNQEIRREYVGSFTTIKDALNNIIQIFNAVISDIANASEQVASGAKSISESSMMLATGATEQASSVEELNATMLTINENTSRNAESSKTAEELSNSARGNASKGDSDMKNMLTAMEGIKESSGKISKIIQVIEDIAFQTNLLALNAAVEAARAGEHGKGFAVVSEEVRTLASRSQTAAKETAALIEESIVRVSEGTRIADKTDAALKTIVGDIEKITEIIADIAVASHEQADAVNQVVEGLDQITRVVQDNSATSEETASASEELSSQSEVMRNLISVFKLKK